MIDKLKKYEFCKNNLGLIPEEPGVYIFYNGAGNIIYIGKAKSLKIRLKTYFNKNVFGKTDKLVNNIKKLSFIKVGSEIEAILLEAKLIKNMQPYYNIALKDDKSQLYVVISNEKYPRLTTGRLTQIKTPYEYCFGPFINTRVFYSILKVLRKIVPFSTHLPSKRPCLYWQMGLCNPCPSQIENTKDSNAKMLMIKSYKSNIRSLVRFFKGDFKYLKNEFNKKMVIYSKNEEYEKANIYKKRLFYLNILLTPPNTTEKYTDDPYYIDIVRKKEQSELEQILAPLIKGSNPMQRIECYDISHIQGSQSTGSMVTFIRSSPDKNYYRHFRLRKSKNNDVSSLKEIAKRRTKHFKDWGRADMIVVDGGKAQVNAFKEVFDKYDLPVVGIAKRYEKLIVPIGAHKFKEFRLSGHALHLVQRMRDEAHRFAQKYHHLLVNRNLINADKIKL